MSDRMELSAAESRLWDPSPLVRCAAIDAIALEAGLDSENGGKPVTRLSADIDKPSLAPVHLRGVSRIFLTFLQDPNSHVRHRALLRLLEVQRLRIPLFEDSQIFPLLFGLMLDACEDVQISAAEIACDIATQASRIASLVPTALLPEWFAGSPPRFLNVLFLRISLLSTNSNVMVRLRVAELLGKFEAADSEWIALALVKEVGIRSGNPLKQGGRGRAWKKRRLDSTGSSSTGLPSIPDEHLALVDPDSPGAFVHGLEDELAAVRQAAMGVRAAACSAVQNCAAGVVLTTQSYDGALAALSDAHTSVRRAARGMIGALGIPKEGGVDALLLAAETVLMRYPAEAGEVRSCLAAAGKSGWEAVESVVEQLMGIDGVFVVKERRLDDSQHVARLSLISGAGSADARVLLKVPVYALEHMEHYRGREPESFPGVKPRPQQPPPSSLRSIIDARTPDAIEDLMNTYLVTAANRLRGGATVLRGFFQCSLIYEKLKHTPFDLDPAAGLRLCSQLVQTSYTSQFSVEGLNEPVMIEFRSFLSLNNKKREAGAVDFNEDFSVCKGRLNLVALE
ncbi:hypothetical protein HDU93_003107 [Gonapodya sp. JEL0774]|nr:hypothetical protein HDU93_003107 [Gonapodya sp. JEL0774]